MLNFENSVKNLRFILSFLSLQNSVQILIKCSMSMSMRVSFIPYMFEDRRNYLSDSSTDKTH